jgi:ABC-type multidrug transport system ATPase subunit
VAIIAGGQLRALGSPDALRAEAHQQTRVEVSFRTPVEASGLCGLPGVEGVEARGSDATLRATDPAAAVSALVRRLDAAGNALTEISVAQPTLEDLYLEYTGGAR